MLRAVINDWLQLFVSIDIYNVFVIIYDTKKG